MTKNTNFRLPDMERSQLHTLAELDNISSTEAIKRLIRSAYTTRRNEIRAFRESQKLLK